MAYHFLEDIAIADVAFEATGRDLPELFRSAADATLATMVEEPGSIQPRIEKVIELEDEALDLLLFDLLQELIYYKDAELLLLRLVEADVAAGTTGYTLRARARGEHLDPSRHRQCADVKAVTLHRFALEQTPEGWRCLVILDV
ncbi:MAG: archease [Acidobacteriota bacterium]